MPRVYAFLRVRVAESTVWNEPAGKPPCSASAEAEDEVVVEEVEGSVGEDSEDGVAAIVFFSSDVVVVVDAEMVVAADKDDEEAADSSGSGASLASVG